MIKTRSIISLFAVMVISQASFGSSIVCSGEQLYSSFTRNDFGTQPPQGTALGKNVIVYQGNVLLDFTFIQGLGQFKILPYDVQLEGPVQTLEKTGNMISGSKIFKQIAVLSKLGVNPNEKEEITRQAVVCRKTWAMVP